VNNYKTIIVIVLSCFAAFTAVAQPKSIDGVIAVVGDHIISQSELEEQFATALSSDQSINEDSRCAIFEELLFQKLLLNQAEDDSLYVTDDQIRSEIDRRLRFFISQFGSKEKLEAFYEKSVEEIREEFYDLIERQLLIQQMQGEVTKGVEVTPKEIRAFYASFPKDSLPKIPAEVEIAQIFIKPPVAQEEVARVKDKLREFRQRVTDGEDFGTLAYLYSEDPGSASENGELGFMTRGALVPEFAAAAFNLEPGEMSGIVETEYGYHLIQAVERRGQEANVRHILLIPKVKTTDMIYANTKADSVYNLIVNDSLTFEEAAKLFSDDEESNKVGGSMSNPITGGVRFTMNDLRQIDPNMLLVLDDLKEGDVSQPELSTRRDGSKGYRILKLKLYSEAHTANLERDYQRISQVATARKEAEVIQKWVNSHINSYYLSIDESFQSCTFEYDWLKYIN